jgi:hypothetical protein
VLADIARSYNVSHVGPWLECPIAAGTKRGALLVQFYSCSLKTRPDIRGNTPQMATPRCRLKKNGPLGLAELMFLRSTPGRMGNLLISSPHLATKSVCEGS